MSNKFTPALGFVARELAPLDPIPKRKLPTGMSEDAALRTFFALNTPTCPLLAHLPEYGFDLHSTRDFLSAFAGQEIAIPSRRTLARAWDDFQLWLAVECRVAAGEPLDVAQTRVASKAKLPVKKVEEVCDRFGKAHKVVKR